MGVSELKDYDLEFDAIKRKKSITAEEKARMEIIERQRKIREDEIRKAEDIVMRKRIREQIKKEYMPDEKDKKQDDKVTTEEIVSITGKAKDKFDTDPRSHLIPSIMYGKGILDKKHAVAIDDEQFELSCSIKFSESKVSEYINKMIEYFDIEPYCEIENKVVTRDDDGNIISEKIVGYETRPNRLPLFSRFGFKVGLTSDDINKLKRENKRFEQAYKLCVQMQEYILVTNMLLGLYGSNTSIFTAKNLIGWKNESNVDLSGNIDMGTLLERVMENNDDDKFIEEKDEKK